MPTDTDTEINLPIFTDILGEISAIIESRSDENVFILGDFNAHPNERFYNELLNFCNDQLWVCADVQKLGISSNSYTYISDTHGTCRWLDHCVVSLSAWQTISEVKILNDVWLSDHLPIFVKSNLNVIRPKLNTTHVACNAILWGERDESQINKYRELCNNKFKNVLFPTVFEKCSGGTCNIGEHKQVLDTLYDEIVMILSESAVLSKTSKSKARNAKSLCRWNDVVREAHCEARRKFKNWIYYNRPTVGLVYDEMCEARRIFKGRLKWCQKHQEQLKMDLLAELRSKNNFSKFWKETRKHDIKPGQPTCVNGMSEPEDIANMFMEHFKVQSPLGPSTGVVDAVPACLGEESLTLFTAKDIKTVIKSMSGGKSPGHDGLSIEHFKYAGVHLPRILASFLSLCLTHSHLPAAFMRTVVVPIIKNRTGDISDKGNYRPISLATTAAKILDSMLDTCLNKYLNLDDAQFGFRPGLSTESAILALKHTVQYYTSRRTPVYACFLDLSRAFDLVSYDALWKKLRDRGVPADVLCILQYWYLNQVNVVRWSNACSEPYRLECGVRQGGRTSPKLFSLYVNDLIAGLSSARVGCMVDGVNVNNISYADDMVLLGPTVGSIRHLLGMCESYAERHGLVYNVKKSEYMVFEVTGKNTVDHPDILLNGKSINKVSTFKYLGHLLTSDLTDNVDIERERRSLATRGNMLVRRFSRCNEQVKVTLFKAYCQSLYTGSLWTRHTKTSLNTLRIQYNNVFRMLLGLPRHCSASGMFAQYETDGFHAVLRKKTTSLMRSVRGSGNCILKTVSNRLDSPLWQSLVKRVITENPLLPPL